MDSILRAFDDVVLFLRTSTESDSVISVLKPRFDHLQPLTSLVVYRIFKVRILTLCNVLSVDKTKKRRSSDSYCYVACANRNLRDC